MSEKMREDFEEWFYEYSLPCEGDWFKRDSCGDYDSPSTYYAWMGWQASRAALVAELPANCKGMALTVDELRAMLGEIGVTLK